MEKAPPAIIYCSGPLFSPEERWLMEAIASRLEGAGFATFLPHRDGLEKHVLSLANDPRGTLPGLRDMSTLVNRAIFALDIFQVVARCDALVFNMNGRVPDEGGVAETAVAFASGKPLVIYKDDARTKFLGADNCMITGLSRSFSKVNHLDAIVPEVGRVLAAARAEGPSPYRDNPPPHVRRVLSLGRKVWAAMEAVRFFGEPLEGSRKLLAAVAGLCREEVL